MPASKYLMLMTVTIVLLVTGTHESVLAQSKAGQSNSIILQNQGASNPSNKAIILQNNNKNTSQQKLTDGPKQLPPDPCKNKKAC
jgi:hypothetical protein